MCTTTMIGTPMTSPSRSARLTTLSEAIARVAWAGLAALHVLPLWRTCAAIGHEGLTLSRLGAGIVLITFLAFFVLKAAGAAFLRFRCNRLALVAFLVCCGLIHGDDAAQWAKDPGHAVVTWAIAGTATAAVASAPSLRRKVAEFFERLLDLALSLLPDAHLCFAPGDVAWRAGPAPGQRSGVPRGPPSIPF